MIQNSESSNLPKVVETWRVGTSEGHVAVQVGPSVEPVFLLPPLQAIALGRALVAQGQALLADQA